ncbi:MAG: FHA domain-containing protein [Acidobacteria bacterium]|nr:FHA domain-containing protein [Acidobacteriota bacterium]
MLKKIKDWIDNEKNEEIIKPVAIEPTESEKRLQRLLDNIKQKALDKKIIRVGGEMYLPGVYNVFLNTADFNSLLDSEKKFLEKKLREIILLKARELAGDNQLTTDKIEVRIHHDGTLPDDEIDVRNSDDLQATIELGKFDLNPFNRTYELPKTVKIDLPPTIEQVSSADADAVKRFAGFDPDGTVDMTTGTIDADDVIDFEPLYYLEIWNDGRKLEDFPILKNHITIGRETNDQAANIRLKTGNKQISRLHASIRYKSKSEITVASLHKNITKVGDTVISGGKEGFPTEAALLPGDEIRIFDFTFKLRV